MCMIYLFFLSSRFLLLMCAFLSHFILTFTASAFVIHIC